MSADDKNARTFTVAAARVEDIDAIVALERATEDAPHWQRQSYADMVQGNGPAAGDDLRRYSAVAKGPDGQIFGFAVGCAHPRLTDSAVLESIGVARAARRAGTGRALCEAVFIWCRRQGATEISLEVRGRSAGAIGLYRGLGFVEAGMRPGYYADPVDDALMMRKDLACS